LYFLEICNHYVIANSTACASIICMNSKHRKTLQVIFTDPVNGNLEWRKIEALFIALGAEKDEGNGSAVTFILNDKRVDFHRPHPSKEALRYRIKAAREFLEKAGITE
jgi:hypothetical protein